MRRAVLTAATAVALVAPTALAFAAGGYNDRPRLIAGIVAWSLFAVAVLAGAPPLPRRPPGRLALAGWCGGGAWPATAPAPTRCGSRRRAWRRCSAWGST